MKQTEFIPPVTSEAGVKPLRRSWLNLSLLDGVLLVAALVAAYLPVDWTRDLKRIKQAPLYAWWGLGYFVIYALAVWWVFRPSSVEARYRHKWLALVGLTLLPNLFNVWLRANSHLPDGSLLFGQDADMTLFFKYGSDLSQGLVPASPGGQYAEYPQFALLLFWLGYLVSGGQQNGFNFAFPALLTLFQLGAALALYATGRKLGQARAGFLLAAFVAGCPALFSFSATRFDVAPAALLVAAVYFYLPTPKENDNPKNAIASGLFTAAGGLMKWLPGVVAPWLAAGYVQARRWRQLAIFAGSAAGLALVTLVPFYLWNSAALWYPYQFQGGRKLIGESFWFLIQRDLLDLEHVTPEKPWGEPAKIILGNNKLLAAQLGLTLLVLALSVWGLWWRRRKATSTDWEGWAAAGLVGVAVFTLANRIFSPQYLILLAWAWALALLLRPVGCWNLIAAFALISIAASANFQVYLLGVYPEEWVRDSWIMFAAGWLLCGWIIWRIIAPRRNITSPDI